MRARRLTPPEAVFGPRVSRPANPTLHVVGVSLLMLAPGLAVCGVIEWASADSPDADALFASAAIAGLLGWILRRAFWVGTDVHVVSVFSAVAWTWIACSLVGALPYVMGGMFEWSRFDDAFFESASGFSCTGSTVLTDIEAHGRGILMWRQLTQWYGGMGMVVLAVSVLPFLGVGGLALMTAEAPGPGADRLVPRVSETARRLWVLYCGITVAIAVALWVAPRVELYDAVAHALTTSATGGFSPNNASIGHYDSVFVELVIVVGLVLCGMSFALHHRFASGELGVYRRSADTRLYLGSIVVGIVAVWAINYLSGTASAATSLRDGVFNVVTLASSGGFGNVRESGGIGDFVGWAVGAQVVLLGAMVVGGCIGSTAGGVKTYRVLIAWRHLRRSLRRAAHPNAVLPVKLGDRAVPQEVVASALGFLLLYFVIAGAATVVVVGLGSDLETGASGVVSAMSNMGPALGEAGPSSNFTVFTRPARLVLASLMIVGRLELMAVLLMFAAPARALRHRTGARPVRRTPARSR